MSVLPAHARQCSDSACAGGQDYPYTLHTLECSDVSEGLIEIGGEVVERLDSY